MTGGAPCPNSKSQSIRDEVDSGRTRAIARPGISVRGMALMLEVKVLCGPW